jgi:hypothetical protein
MQCRENDLAQRQGCFEEEGFHYEEDTMRKNGLMSRKGSNEEEMRRKGSNEEERF